MSSKIGHKIEAPLKNAFLTSRLRHEGSSTLDLESSGVNCFSQAFSSCFKVINTEMSKTCLTSRNLKK